MATVRLVRHGRATGGWDADPDPGLDDVGAAQALVLRDALVGLRSGSAGPDLVTSPLRRCRETAAPLAAAWGVAPAVEALVAEVPSPEGIPFGRRVPWLQEAIAGTWTALGPRYTDYRDAVVAFVADLTTDTVVVSHFIAINTVIGHCLGDDRVMIHRLDNTSVTVVETSPTGLALVSTGVEAETQLR
jgi:broad specificity phosphatase PhoE